VVLFSSNKFNFIKWAIREITKARVCHAGLYFGSGKREVIEAEGMGVERGTLDGRLGSKSEMMWIYAYRPMSVAQLQSLKSYSNGAVGKRYDYKSILKFIRIPGLGGDNESSVICSELVVRAYAEIGVKICPDQVPGTVDPGDIQRWCEARPEEWRLVGTQNVKA
jgi:uncharacterized protein YycO